MSSNFQELFTGINRSQTDSSKWSCKRRKAWKLLETIINSRQGPSRNKISNFSDINSWKHVSGSAIIFGPDSIAMQMGGIPRNKWEAHWKSESTSLSSGLSGTGSTAMQIGYVLQYRSRQNYYKINSPDNFLVQRRSLHNLNDFPGNLITYRNTHYITEMNSLIIFVYICNGLHFIN